MSTNEMKAAQLCEHWINGNISVALGAIDRSRNGRKLIAWLGIIAVVESGWPENYRAAALAMLRRVV